MDYTIVIREHNQKPHLDIEGEAQRLQNGMFTFILKVADSNIMDLVFLSYESYESFEGFEELSLSYVDRT